MATIDVKTETEGTSNWAFEVEVREDGRTHPFNVTLSWSDYDLWSRGRVAPQRVVEAAFEFLLEREPVGSILQKFDCSLIRRYFSEVDQELPKLI